MEPPDGRPLRDKLGLSPDTRTVAQFNAAEEEQDACNLAHANMRLSEKGLPQLGKAGKPLDDIFCVLKDAGLLHRSGAVMLSPEVTLRPAPLMFMGLNPGGNENEVETTLLDNLVFCRMGESAWEEVWKGKAGEAALQRRFKYIAEFNGVAPLTIPSTNVVFTRSRDLTAHGQWAADRRLALPVHQILAAVVKPKTLWFMGNTDAAGELFTDLRMQWRPSAHGDWSIGHGTAVYAGLPVTICHTPHLSRWDPTGKEDELRFAFGVTG